MGRGRKSEFEQLLSLPWWVWAVAGAVAFALVGWLLPSLLATEDTYADLHAAMQVPALLALGVGLTLSGASAWHTHQARAGFVTSHGLGQLRRLRYREFQSRVAAAFARRGYEIGRKCRGVDLVLIKDGRRYFVACKQWKQFNVSAQQLIRLQQRMTEEAASGGFFISAGVFTRDARTFAAEMNIELIGGVSLQRFLESEETHKSPAPYPEPVFLSSTAMTVPVCPSCGSPMIRRVAKFGKTAGEEFWCCPHYPHCRGTRYY